MQSTVHFSKIKEEIIINLKKAKREIKVAIAWLTDEDLIRVLTQRREAGLDVQIAISDSKENFKNINKFKEYLRFQGKLFITTKPFLHHKFCIIDDSIIINGSYNWSYPARKNEENIIVMLLHEESKPDKDFLTRFVVKHKYLCDKCSSLIQDMTSLSAFKSQIKDTALILSEIDEYEVNLRQEFENDVRISFDKAVAARIPISHLLLERMKSDGGGVEFVKRILHDEISSGDMKSGFKKLEEQIPPRIELSLEYLVSRSKYEMLFTPEEVRFCKNLMKKYDL